MSRVFINGVLTEVGQGADEIISLLRQLDELKANSQAVLQTQSEAWQREVAESHAREVMLRASFDQLLQATEVSNVTTSTLEIVCRRARMLPTDDTALRELIERGGKVMRERCAKFVKQNLYSNQTDIEAIRAIPVVTLEDLQK